jgi:hypothetical protein
VFVIVAEPLTTFTEEAVKVSLGCAFSSCKRYENPSNSFGTVFEINVEWFPESIK